MRTLWVLLLLAASVPARAQEPETNTVTVFVTSAADVRPEKVNLYVGLLTPVAVGLDEVLARLKGTGITAADLSYVYSPYGIPPDDLPALTQWTFTPAVTFDKLNAVLTALTQIAAAEETIMGSPALRFEVTGTEAPAPAGSCPVAAMVADARRQAAAMAAAAGARAGTIVSLTDGGPVVIFGSADRWFNSIGGVLAGSSAWSNSSLIRTYGPACGLTVQFKLIS